MDLDLNNILLSPCTKKVVYMDCTSANIEYDFEKVKCLKETPVYGVSLIKKALIDMSSLLSIIKQVG